MYTAESTPSPSLAKMLGSSKLTLFLSLIKNCCEKLGEPANDRIASGSDFEEVAILEALKAMLNIRHDVVVVLESTTKEKILEFRDGEGALREGGEGDLVVHIPFELDIHGGFEDDGFAVGVLGVGAVEVAETVATGPFLLSLALSSLDFLTS